MSEIVGIPVAIASLILSIAAGVIPLTPAPHLCWVCGRSQVRRRGAMCESCYLAADSIAKRSHQKGARR
jgi:hypothetical protein